MGPVALDGLDGVGWTQWIEDALNGWHAMDAWDGLGWMHQVRRMHGMDWTELLRGLDANGLGWMPRVGWMHWVRCMDWSRCIEMRCPNGPGGQLPATQWPSGPMIQWP